MAISFTILRDLTYPGKIPTHTGTPTKLNLTEVKVFSTSFRTSQTTLKTNLRKNENKFWNKLDTNQRKALLDLENDASIIIKPADKGGAIVIMNSNDYSEACLNSLLDTDFYEKLPNDAKPEYKAKINDKIDDLLSKELINDFEASNLKQGSRTPHFLWAAENTQRMHHFPTAETNLQRI